MRHRGQGCPAIRFRALGIPERRPAIVPFRQRIRAAMLLQACPVTEIYPDWDKEGARVRKLGSGPGMPTRQDVPVLGMRTRARVLLPDGCRAECIGEARRNRELQIEMSSLLPGKPANITRWFHVHAAERYVII